MFVIPLPVVILVMLLEPAKAQAPMAVMGRPLVVSGMTTALSEPV